MTETAVSSVTLVGVLGSGIMGAGLAEVAARAGFDVVVRSRSQSTADEMLDALDRSLGRQVDKGRMSDDERKAIVDRITATCELADLANCDLIIESIVEDLATKKALFAELDKIAKPSAILATNTSTLPIVEIAMATSRPDRVCGIHFFNPAPAMKLAELVRPITASDETMATATAFAQACGKDSVAVIDRAGFIVNALLFPYLNNAIRMFEHGTASMEDIDTAMRGGCNFPMGPFALLDLVGLDTSLSILDALYAEFGDPNYAAAPTLRRKVAANQLGRKTRKGFFTYE
jgi:3-hydroxybutyryl-CoA dehydrogenase